MRWETTLHILSHVYPFIHWSRVRGSFSFSLFFFVVFFSFITRVESGMHELFRRACPNACKHKSNDKCYEWTLIEHDPFTIVINTSVRFSPFFRSYLTMLSMERRWRWRRRNITVEDQQRSPISRRSSLVGGSNLLISTYCQIWSQKDEVFHDWPSRIWTVQHHDDDHHQWWRNIPKVTTKRREANEWMRDRKAETEREREELS